MRSAVAHLRFSVTALMYTAGSPMATRVSAVGGRPLFFDPHAIQTG
ncbi:hypothetical protein [Streptomyces laurentii]